ncbi:hypothetical protein KVC_0142 [Ketogulonicigenium vulgare]|nr:hypothetical protein KVC_0142 [Ketogulonicigenium vulgare]
MAALATAFSSQGFRVIDAPHSELAPLFRRQGASRKDRAGVLVTGGFACADVGPGLKILDRVENPATDFAIGRTGPVGPMLFQRAKRNTKETCSFLSTQHARWKVRVSALGHEITSGSSG